MGRGSGPGGAMTAFDEGNRRGAALLRAVADELPANATQSRIDRTAARLWNTLPTSFSNTDFNNLMDDVRSGDAGI